MEEIIILTHVGDVTFTADDEDGSYLPFRGHLHLTMQVLILTFLGGNIVKRLKNINHLETISIEELEFERKAQGILFIPILSKQFFS